MSKVCQVTGKRPVTGNNVSHAHNKTKRRFLPNLHTHRFWVESENRWVKLRLTTKGMRIIDKKGIDATKSASTPPQAPVTSTPPTRTSATCPKRWRSRSSIPSFASTLSTRKARLSKPFVYR